MHLYKHAIPLLVVFLLALGAGVGYVAFIVARATECIGVACPENAVILGLHRGRVERTYSPPSAEGAWNQIEASKSGGETYTSDLAGTNALYRFRPNQLFSSKQAEVFHNKSVRLFNFHLHPKPSMVYLCSQCDSCPLPSITLHDLAALKQDDPSSSTAPLSDLGVGESGLDVELYSLSTDTTIPTAAEVMQYACRDLPWAVSPTGDVFGITISPKTGLRVVTNLSSGKVAIPEIRVVTAPMFFSFDAEARMFLWQPTGKNSSSVDMYYANGTWAATVANLTAVPQTVSAGAMSFGDDGNLFVVRAGSGVVEEFEVPSGRSLKTYQAGVTEDCASLTVVTTGCISPRTFWLVLGFGVGLSWALSTAVFFVLWRRGLCGLGSTSKYASVELASEDGRDAKEGLLTDDPERSTLTQAIEPDSFFLVGKHSQRVLKAIISGDIRKLKGLKVKSSMLYKGPPGHSGSHRALTWAVTFRQLGVVKYLVETLHSDVNFFLPLSAQHWDGDISNVDITTLPRSKCKIQEFRWARRVDGDGPKAILLAMSLQEYEIATYLLSKGAQFWSEEVHWSELIADDDGEGFVFATKHCYENRNTTPGDWVIPKLRRIMQCPSPTIRQAVLDSLHLKAITISDECFRTDALELLCEHQVDVTAQVYAAIVEKNLEAVRYLLEKGVVRINTALPRHGDSVHSESVLHLAARIGDESIVKALIARGADIRARDSTAAQPVTYAANDKIAAMLRDMPPVQGGSAPQTSPVTQAVKAQRPLTPRTPPVSGKPGTPGTGGSTGSVRSTRSVTPSGRDSLGGSGRQRKPKVTSEDCTACDGRGIYPVQCPDCRGSGRNAPADSAHDDDGDDARPAHRLSSSAPSPAALLASFGPPCRRCQGSGKIRESCGACNGSGFIYAVKPLAEKKKSSRRQRPTRAATMDPKLAAAGKRGPSS